MKTTWTAGLSPQDKADVESSYKAGAYLRQRLAVVLNDKRELSRSDSFKKSNYDSPSWALQQADSVGYQRAMEEIISLISDSVSQKS